MKKVREKMGNEEDFSFGDLKKFLKPKPKKEIKKKKAIIEEHPIVRDYDEFIEKVIPEEKVEKIEKIEPVTIKCDICKEEIPDNFYDDHFAKCKAEEGIAEGLEIPSEIKEMLVHEKEVHTIGFEIIKKIEKIEINWDLEILQKLITVKNVLNYSQSTWSLGVCNEILGAGSIRGGKSKVGYSLMKTIKKICKLK